MAWVWLLRSWFHCWLGNTRSHYWLLGGREFVSWLTCWTDSNDNYHHIICIDWREHKRWVVDCISTTTNFAAELADAFFQDCVKTPISWNGIGDDVDYGLMLLLGALFNDVAGLGWWWWVHGMNGLPSCGCCWCVCGGRIWRAACKLFSRWYSHRSPSRE